MSANNSLVEKTAPVQAIAPQDINGSAVDGDFINLKLFEHVHIVIDAGTLAGGPSAVTLRQATDVAGAGAKTLGFTNVWISGANTDVFTKTAVVSDTFDITGTDDNKQFVIEVDASELDVPNSFNTLQVQLGSPGAVSFLVAAKYYGTGARYAGADMASALIN